MLPKVLALCCTYGRHTCLERLVRTFIDQDYKGEHTLLIYNNSPVEQNLDRINLPENKKILLINNSKDFSTGESYSSTGAVFRDAITFIPEDHEITAITDDDDIYLPEHITEGVKGINKAKKLGKKVYKPYYSYFKTSSGISLAHNNMEPSSFILSDYLKDKGFKPSAVDYHDGWLQDAKDNQLLYVEPTGKPTFIYDWSEELKVHKISGDLHNPENFNNHLKYSADHGDRLITPWDSYKIKKYYKV